MIMSLPQICHHIIRSKRLQMSRNLQELRKQFEWKFHTNVLSVNAYYNHLDHLVFLPLPVIDEPLFQSDRPSYLNLASVGFIVGHEMLHMFDFPCDFRINTFSGKWCSPLVSKRLLAKSTCVKSAYANLVSKSFSADRTVLENVADLGGLRLAWKVMQKENKQQPKLAGLHNYTQEQLFFISYAMVSLF